MGARRDEMALEHQSRVRGAGTWRRTNCSFCELRGFGYDRRGNWCLNVGTGYYHCWRCAVRGYLPGYEPTDHEDEPEPELAPGALDAPEGYTPLSERSGDVRPARRYVLKRGISPDTARQAKLGVCLSGPYAGRIIVPVLETDGHTWTGWSGRLYVPRRGEPPYRYPEGMPRYRIVYNPRALRQQTDEPLLCVEGVFDALPYFPHAIAFLGKPGNGQLPLLLEAQRPLVICLDGDAWCEGEMLAEKLLFLGYPHGVGWVRLPPTTDPNTVNRAWLLDAARRSLRFPAAPTAIAGH